MAASMQTLSSKVSAGTRLAPRKLNLSRKRAILPVVAASAGHSSGTGQAAAAMSLSVTTATAAALLLAPNAISADLSEAFRSPQAHGPGSTLVLASVSTNPELAGNLKELAAVNQQLKAKAVEQPYGAVTEAAQQYTDEISDQIKDAAAGTKATVKNVSSTANSKVEQASDTVKGAAKTASRKVEKAGGWWKGFFGNIKYDTKAAADKVQANVKQAADKAGFEGNALADKAQANVKQAAGKVGADGNALADKAQINVKQAAGKVGSEGNALADKAQVNVKQAAGEVGDGKAISEQVQANVKQAAGNVQANVTGAAEQVQEAGDQATEGIKNQLGSVKTMLGL